MGILRTIFEYAKYKMFAKTRYYFVSYYGIPKKGEPGDYNIGCALISCQNMNLADIANKLAEEGDFRKAVSILFIRELTKREYKVLCVKNKKEAT